MTMRPGVWVEGPVVLVFHEQGPAEPLISEICDTVRAQALLQPNGLALVMVLNEGAQPPKTGARETFLEMMRGERDSILAFAVVMLGSGFWAAAARSVISILSLTGRLPAKVFSKPKDAHAWVVEALRNHPEFDGAALARGLGLGA